MSGDEARDGRPGGIRHSLRALRNRDFAVFWTGAFIANTGNWFQSLAVPYVLFLITDSALWVGLAAAGQFVPGLLLGPLAGVMAERGNLRRNLIILQLLRAAVALSMLIVWVSDAREPLLLVALITASGCAQGLAMPSWQAFVHRISPRDALSSAVTLNTVQFNLARSFGPAIGGLILLWSSPTVAFALTSVALASVVTALVLVRVRTPAAPAVVRQSVMREFGEALRYVGTQPGIVVAFVIVACVGVIGMPVFQHVIVFSEAVFLVGALGLAVLNLGLGIGTVIGVPLVAGFEQRVSRARLAAWSLPAYGLAMVGFGLAPNMVVGFVILVFIGIFFLIALSVGINATQMIVADRMRGRVLAIHTMLYAGTVAFGAWLQGLVTDLIGPRPAVIAAGIVLVVVALVLIVWRGRYNLRRVDDPFDQG